MVGPAVLLDGLNDAQRRAVTSTDGPVLIVAGPGSGKTRVLTHRVAYLIDALGVSPWNVLAVTFTNKAAREMRERLENLVGLERSRQLTVGTFHATCARILRRDAQLIGVDPHFTIYDDADQMETIKQALKALNLDPKQFAPRPILSRISAAKSQFIAPTRFAEQVQSYWEEVVARVYPMYQETLRRNRALDFDDLLAETLRLFDEQPDALQRYQDHYRYVLVDEYQDTNRVQYLLVRALSASHRNICVVGDPDQSIYGWRHADIRNILDFKRDYPDATEIHLELNYRSTRSIVAAADSIIRANTQRIQRKLRTENPAGDPISVRELFDEGQEAQFVVSEIRRLTFSGNLRYRDCAVMYRTNAQSRPLEEAFIRSDMPYQLIGGTRFYERREIKDAMAILRLVANPNDAVSLQRVLQNTPMGKGIGARTIQQVEQWTRKTGRSTYDGLGAIDGALELEPPKVASRAARLLSDVYRVLSQLVQASTTLTLTELFDLAMEQSGFAAQFQDAGDPDAIDRWENVLQLRAVLSTYDDLPEATALQTFLEESALIADADTIADGDDQVTLITLHAAKGLEFPVVFLVGAEEGILPHSRSMDSEAQLEEERRLFYVGVTRAKQRVYISHVFRRAMYGFGDLSLRSRFVDAIPSELVDLVQSRATTTTTNGHRTRGGLAERDVSDEVPSSLLEPLVVGTRVFHDRFGDGVVLKVRDISEDQEVTVEFKRHGQKRLMVSLANLHTG